MDHMPQRELVDEVRILLDDTCSRRLTGVDCGRARCLVNLADLRILAKGNPRSIWSTKVLHNIGQYRTAQLIRAVGLPNDAVLASRARAALPIRYEALVSDS